MFTLVVLAVCLITAQSKSVKKELHDDEFYDADEEKLEPQKVITVEGDIAIAEDDIDEYAAHISSFRLWPKGVLPIRESSSLNDENSK